MDRAEDIDFEMVYALHTFTATVEGQANATKGEHMVLLDDSNSYWWLVRIVRDASIGTCTILTVPLVEDPADARACLVQDISRRSISRRPRSGWRG
jgi:hypothetical protein